ncbi:unnamed protein product [Schistocephalus solidus]|uniref:Reverse transcriptase domain-containing protein n=1 Tax=Schistocephalus solidus TaxID=70667 RepID=A0A183TBU8_SCHSO|nr:unnamed protein product [Schistocephalus solidus]
MGAQPSTRARRHRKSRDDQLSGKFEKISLKKQLSSDDVLVHNLSSHRLTQQQLAVLSYDAKFNTKDARPEDFITSFESAFQKCDAVAECKNAMRQQVLNHDFAFEKTRVIGRANKKMARLVLESWSSTGTLNRAVDLQPAYQALRTRLGSVRPGPIRQTSTRNREPTLTEKRGDGRRSHDQSQTLPHQCARKTENNSREQQRLISPLIDVGEANRHAALLVPTTTPKGTVVTRARRHSTSGRSKEVSSDRAGQNSARRHRKSRDDQLSGKFEKIRPRKQPSSDGALVHNLSSHRLTQQQLAVLSYDAKFNTKDARPEDFIASFESALQKCDAVEECKNAMRQQVVNLLLQHQRQTTISKAEERELLKIRKIEDIVTLPADKGRSTVVMDRSEYGATLSNLLMDKESYLPSTTSDFKKLVNSINKTVDKLRKAGALNRTEALATKATDAAMARFYGLPKVHKPGVALRPIVSLRGTPTFGLSKWLYQRLCFLTKDSKWTVKSADELLTRIKHLEVEADEVMVSFDVILLFTSIPPALAIDTIDGFLQEKYDETDQKLKRAHIFELLELLLAV